MNPYQEEAEKIAKQRLKGCHIIQMPEHVLGNAHHKWGRHPMHYMDAYYEYAGKAVDCIVAKKPREQEEAELERLRQECSNQFLAMRRKYPVVENRKANHIMYEKLEKAAVKPFVINDPVGDQALVKVQYSLMSAGTEREKLLDDTQRFPIQANGSAIGVVEKIGGAVKTLKVGDRVLVIRSPHADYCLQSVKSMVKLPDELPWEEAIFLEAASFPTAAIRRSRFEFGESMVIVGAGVLGLLAVQIASFIGAAPVIVVEKREDRRNMAKAFGADAVFSPEESDFVKKIRQLTKQISSSDGANVIIETSGQEEALHTALPYAAKHGRVMLNGSLKNMTKPIDFYNQVYMKGLELIGTHDNTREPFCSRPWNWTTHREYPLILHYMKSGRIHARDLLSEVVSPEDAGKVYDRLLHDPQFPTGVVFDWTKYHK